MGVDIHISKIPSSLQQEIREIAVPNYVQDDDEEDESMEVGTQADTESTQNSECSTGKLGSLSNNDFKEHIKNMLDNFLLELRSTGIYREKH